ncbi:LacI family transcriptional regulator [Rhodococcus sp. Leaf7]|uniref:LacI family DNA-binding transcriptional regulator n=1 Tax=unclassified Rhodococcus (in: high G+C Gram-positive bacteria) TaxID=192944 RepID=UPI0005ACCD28|nr:MULTISPECIES: LacI family DNA-binding transcriptional regulator [unclassified Rhodococcus (in: high G+C Gram-positive bacteria)]KIQ16044.1 LacI family transcriptional regulator [Rhodococcus sp. MEB064]KQU07540.1 LacI family transcriptional regulator [Rhodococcus sp. Leaf7]KQU43061.1 LacI family transcriptional regulator [Rhodococcus sp. Leaf247]
MTTMQDVATLANVSAKTVSRVYNDDPHVDPATRARVIAALESLNYVPNAIATSFRTGQSGAIGVAVPDIDDPFFSSIARAVEDRARVQGMAVIMTSLGHDASIESAQVESLLRRQLSGLVIAPIGTDQSYLKRWVERTPTVFVDRAPTGITADTFVDDDHGGAHTATTHLLGKGHRRIALVGDDLEITTAFNRLNGYRDALSDNGIGYDDDLVVTGVLDRPRAHEAIEALMAGAHPPTALFLSNARTAMACIPALQSLGARRPAYVAFGDFPLADALCPAVTVIDQNPTELGRMAIDRLLGRIDNPRRRYRRRNVMSVELIERESCSAAE